jgi:hypothetical protein
MNICLTKHPFIRTYANSSRRLVGLGRLELPTSPLSGVRSNQLSYKPIYMRVANGHRPHHIYIAWLQLRNYKPINGGAKQDRTADLLRARQALSQLSYGPIGLCSSINNKTICVNTQYDEA